MEKVKLLNRLKQVNKDIKELEQKEKSFYDDMRLPNFKKWDSYNKEIIKINKQISKSKKERSALIQLRMKLRI